MPVVPSTILLAEDLESDILLIQRAFKKALLVNPLQVVRNGEQCVAYLNGDGDYADRDRHPLPSLLLMDLKMPRMNGLEVLRWIRARPQFSTLRIVVLTASKELTDVNRAYQFGANSFLIKPSDFDQLVVMMEGLQGQWMWIPQQPETYQPSAPGPA
jgi:CheY-like chemotaxis protein